MVKYKHQGGVFLWLEKGKNLESILLKSSKKLSVRLYLEEHLPKRTIASLLGIDKSRVSLWLKNYLTHGTVELKRGRQKKESIEEEMERLRAENAYLKLMMQKILEKKDIKKQK